MSTDPVRPKGSPSPPPEGLPDKSEKTGKAAPPKKTHPTKSAHQAAAAHTPHKPYEKARAKPDLPKPTVRAGRFGKHPPPLTVTRTVIGEQRIPLPGELPPTRTGEQHIPMRDVTYEQGQMLADLERDRAEFIAVFGKTTPIVTQDLMSPEMVKRIQENVRALENTTIGIGLEDIEKHLNEIAKGVASKRALLASEVNAGKPITRFMEILGVDFVLIEGSLSQHLKTLTSPDRGTPTEAEKGIIHKVQRLQTQLAQVQADRAKYDAAVARAGTE